MTIESVMTWTTADLTFSYIFGMLKVQLDSWLCNDFVKRNIEHLNLNKFKPNRLNT